MSIIFYAHVEILNNNIKIFGYFNVYIEWYKFPFHCHIFCRGGNTYNRRQTLPKQCVVTLYYLCGLLCGCVPFYRPRIVSIFLNLVPFRTTSSFVFRGLK